MSHVLEELIRRVYVLAFRAEPDGKFSVTWTSPMFPDGCTVTDDILPAAIYAAFRKETTT